MAFLIHSTADGHQVPWEYLAASAITPKVGMALKLSSGLLAAADTSSTKPEFICMCDAATLTSGDIIPVIRVTEDIIFETTCSASFADRKVGDKVTLASDVLRVTATTTNGVAEVVAIDGTASGSTVRVKF